MKHYLLSILLVGMVGCTSKNDYVLFNKTNVKKNTQQEQTITELKKVAFEYKIQPHDRISLMVYKHPDLSTSSLNSLQQERGILVNSRGDIRLPLIHTIHVAGLSQTEAEQRLSNAFAEYIKNPDVQLEVLNKRAYIIGEVKSPGEIELVNEQLSLLQMIAKAGDLTDQADRSSILILRGQNSTSVSTQVVNLMDINSIRTANLMIKNNDIVYIMPNKMKEFNVKVNEMNPLFSLISNVLTPFVNIKFLSQ